MYKILVIDDEKAVVSLIKDYFTLNQYEVLTAYSAREALPKIKEDPDIILLDINMPETDGLSFCRQVREYVACPILFLTARVEDSDKIKGFAAGGDDYILKPFSIDELGARVAAHIRREHRIVKDNNVRFWGKLAIDYSAKTVTVEGREIVFPKKEFEILELLSLNTGQIFDKERIYETLWGYEAEGNSSVVAEHIRRIRRRLAETGEEYHMETIWGMGYRWKR